jgi:hypothetical protein
MHYGETAHERAMICRGLAKAAYRLWDDHTSQSTGLVESYHHDTRDALDATLAALIWLSEDLSEKVEDELMAAERKGKAEAKAA